MTHLTVDLTSLEIEEMDLFFEVTGHEYEDLVIAWSGITTDTDTAGIFDALRESNIPLRKLYRFLREALLVKCKDDEERDHVRALKGEELMDLISDPEGPTQPLESVA